MQPFLPQVMMLRVELNKARRLLRKLDGVHEEYRMNLSLPKTSQKDEEVFSKRRSVLEADLDALSAEVWKREVGLERYTVLHARRGDLERRFQLLSFSVRDNSGWSGGWMWWLDGRALRKDGTLGSKREGIGFNCAHLQRRHLDGIWRELRWRGMEAE